MDRNHTPSFSLSPQLVTRPMIHINLVPLSPPGRKYSRKANHPCISTKLKAIQFLVLCCSVIKIILTLLVNFDQLPNQMISVVSNSGSVQKHWICINRDTHRMFYQSTS